MANVCVVINEDVCLFFVCGKLLLAPIAACDVVTPVFDCVIDLSVL